MREQYTQAPLLIFRPSIDVLAELRKNRALYIPEQNDPWITLYNISDILRMNLNRVKSNIEETSGKRIGDHPVMNAAIMLGAQWLAQEKEIDPLLDIRHRFNRIDNTVDHLIARVINDLFEAFPITLDTGRRQTLKMPINIHRIVASLAEDTGTTINNIAVLSMMRSLSILPETIYESGQDMLAKVDEFRRLCNVRYRAMKAILEEFEL